MTETTTSLDLTEENMDIDNQHDDKDDDTVSLADSWTPTDFKEQASTFFELKDNLEEENRTFKRQRKDRDDVRKNLESEVVKYMKDNETAVNFKNARMVVREIRRANPLNKTKLRSILTTYFEQMEEKATGKDQMEDCMDYIEQSLGEKVEYKLSKQVSEEEQSRQKRLRAEERKRRNLLVAAAKRRIAEATKEGRTPDADDLNIITS